MRHYAFGVDKMLLTSILKRIMFTLGVLQSSGKLIWSPPIMSLVRFTSSLFSLLSQLKLPYVTSFILLGGTSSFCMSQMVLVGFTRPSLSPLANLLNLFTDDFDHSFLYFGCCMSCQ